MTEDDRYPVDAPGWAAIDRALEVAYPGQVPHQFASQTGYDLESSNPLPAIGVYEGRAPDHWHYVTYGLTELFEKSSSQPDISGFGFELTLRIPRVAGQVEPDRWPLNLLQGIGHYVLSGHEPLDTGHVIDLGSPLSRERPSQLEGVVCIPDPTLGKLNTLHGSVLFLQLFGLARPELQAMADWELDRKVGVVRECEPLGITELGRAAWVDDPRHMRTFRRYALGVLLD